MVFGPWIEVFIYTRALLPDFSGFKFKLPSFDISFIFLHYIYLLSLTIIGSVILYPAKNMAYIDALFFASGAATQSGLNTLNVNDILLYQQITLTIVACIANPIFINTFVVFVRLYWFEKRFQHVVLEASNNRRTRERTRTKSEAKGDRADGIDLEERAVGGRKIVVMHAGTATMDRAVHPEKAAEHTIEQSKAEESSSSSGASGQSSSADTGEPVEDHERDLEKGTKRDQRSDLPESPPRQPLRRDIMFADEVPKLAPPANGDHDADEHPDQLLARHFSPDEHIAFLENQRNPKDKGTLYIPGPRDFDQGRGPQEISDDESDGAPHVMRTPKRSTRDSIGAGASNEDDELGRTTSRKKSLVGATNLVVKAKRGLLSNILPQGTERVSRSDTMASGNDQSFDTTLRRRGRLKSFSTFMKSENDTAASMPYLSYDATIGRNSAFVNLTPEQREELGGIEYRALKSLAWVLCIYFFGFHLLGIVSFIPWIVRSRRYRDLVEADGVSPAWWAVFTSASMFNDLGYTLTPDSMISFQYAIFPLLLGSYLIVIGNTGFPCMLRFVIWVLSKVVPKGSSLWEEYRFLLDHPRRCFTLLFPSKATWWLFWVLVVLNGLDLVFFIVLDLHDPVITVLPAGIRVLSGWFQAVSTRTAGFAVVNLAALHPGVQVSYLIMMYISIFPIAISVRRTNVYEERSLGVWQPHDEDDDGENKSGLHSYVGNHLRRQLSFDLWFVFLGLFVIAIAEGSRLQDTNEFAFTIFAVLFEVVSAYGTVGLSLGYPGIDESFSAEFNVISKLVIIAMQIRGRHRGLPYALDKAIMLPSEDQQKKENEEGLRRMERSLTGMSTARSVRSMRREPDLGDQHAFRSSDIRSKRDTDRPYDDNDDHIVPTSRKASLLTENTAEREKKKVTGGIARLLESAFSAGPSKRD